MAITQEASTQDLSLVVEPLVDAISELVLSTITAAFENVQNICINIAERTNKLVMIAQEVASSSTDIEMQTEVANAISAIASSIESLVLTFNDLLTLTVSKGNKARLPDAQQAFAKAAKDVGEAINKLVAATDQTVQRKIIQAVKDALQTAKLVQEAAFQGRDALLGAAQQNVDRTVKLVAISMNAALSAADEKKKQMFIEGANRVKSGSPLLIQAAKNVAENRNNANAVAELEKQVRELSAAFSVLINAAKLAPTYFGKAAETYEYVKKLVEAAKSLEEVFGDLYQKAKTGTTEEFVETAKLAAAKAVSLVEQAQQAMAMEKDPVKKQLIKDAITELREASSAMIKASRAYRENPNDPNLKAELERSHARLEAAIKVIVSSTGNDVEDQSTKGRLATASNALESAAKRLVSDSTKNPSELAEDANILAAIALQFVTHAEKLAEETSDPARKKAILDNAYAIKDAATRIIAAARKVAENPNDPQALKELEAAHQSLLEKIENTKKAAQIIPGYDDLVDTSRLEFDMGKSAEAQLVAASKEEANAALELATEAEKLISQIADPNKQKQMKEAISQVKLLAKRVLEAADALARNPHDATLQQNLNDAQKDLGEAIQRVVSLSNETKQDRDVAEAMAQMKLDSAASGTSEAKLLATAESLIQDIVSTFGDASKKLSPQEVIANAKKLSENANTLAQQLREMAAATSDPKLKEKLLNSAKIVKDGGIQLKILSAVRAAGGDDKSNTVGNAAKGLQTNIQEIMKEVKAESLKQRYRSTVQSTINIHRVVNAWRKRT